MLPVTACNCYMPKKKAQNGSLPIRNQSIVIVSDDEGIQSPPKNIAFRFPWNHSASESGMDMDGPQPEDVGPKFLESRHRFGRHTSSKKTFELGAVSKFLGWFWVVGQGGGIWGMGGMGTVSNCASCWCFFFWVTPSNLRSLKRKTCSFFKIGAGQNVSRVLLLLAKFCFFETVAF